MNKKQKYILLIGLAALIIIGAMYATTQRSNQAEYFCDPSPAPCKNPSLRLTNEAVYRDATSYYAPGTGGYQCSKSIKLFSRTINKAGERSNFEPVDKNEAALFCHMTSAEEYKGKITVLQKPEVLDLISKYEYKDVKIKALEFELLHSEGFKDRLLPQYKGRNIGCIIILETPNEKMVFLEDENLDTFEQMDYKLLDQQLDKASPEDKKLFVDNLR